MTPEPSPFHVVDAPRAPSPVTAEQYAMVRRCLVMLIMLLVLFAVGMYFLCERVDRDQPTFDNTLPSAGMYLRGRFSRG